MSRIISVLIVVVVVGLLAGGYVYLSAPAAKTPAPLTASTTSGAIRIVALGDSLTAGYGIPLSDSYPSQLEDTLLSEGYAVKVINAGVSGETTSGTLARAQFIRNQKPQIVLLGIGGNDALRLLPVEEARKNIRETISILKSGENPPQVLLLQMQAPLNAGFANKRNFDAIYTDLAEEFDIPLVPFILFEVQLNQKYVIDDGIHLNREGYAVLVEKYIAPAVREVLQEMD